MNNILEYVKRYASSTFKEMKFNEVDGLVFSVLSYGDFSGIVPASFIGSTPIRLNQAIAIYFKKSKTRSEILSPTFLLELRELMRQCALSKRYGSCKLLSFVSNNNQKLKIQFGALAIEYIKDESFVAYRGTDNTVNGWREDFEMSFKQIPAQLAAMDFLEHLFGIYQGRIILGGHSKGGNLAMFAGLMTQGSDIRISNIYNYDGPGLTSELIEHGKYPQLTNIIQNYIPENSVVGLIFETDYTQYIIEAEGAGAKQHNPMRWKVRNNQFVDSTNIATTSLIFQKTMKEWIKNMDNANKKELTEVLFGIIEENGFQSLNEIKDKKNFFVVKYIASLVRISSRKKKILALSINRFLKAGIKGIKIQKLGIISVK